MSSKETPQQQQQGRSSTENTVFVRFHPPSALLRRHHIEHHFSQIGPIKKASLIIPKKEEGEDDETKKASSYGFIRYTCRSDAVAAAKQLNFSKLTLTKEEEREGEPSTFQVKVELASNEVKKQKKSKVKTEDEEQEGNQNDEDKQEVSKFAKKHSRVILRNLSFYAKESHIREAMSEYGTLLEVHVPKVEGKLRGFAFCTFQNPKDAKKAIQKCQQTPLQIKNRAVQVELSVPKAVHQVQKENELKVKRKKEYQEKVKQEHRAKLGQEADKEYQEESGSEDEPDNDGDDSVSDASASGSDHDGEDSENEEKDGDDDDEEEEPSVEDDEEENQEDITEKQNAIEEQRELFVRNLPFDATRHDVFETFRKYGKIAAIYLVSDPKTGLPRGTCFITFDTQVGAARAMEAGAVKATATNSSTTDVLPATGGILMKSRSLLIDYAVDKETANTLRRDPVGDGEGGKHSTKDKRNVYLKGEGRVDDEEAWAALGESDKNKRQSAWADKITKLKSPLFFINPNRLSIRNISKSVDEGALKQLLYNATKKGLEKGLVSVNDLEAQWRASGEMSAREILDRKKTLKTIPEAENPLKVANLDDKNIRNTVPSVFLDRDFSAAPEGVGSKKKALAPSRGFAFAEFEHHVQALACLRELNNNPAYSETYATGGKAAANAAKLAKKRRHKKKRKVDEEEEEAVKIPRLIVEFTVENKAKARQQAERRAQQQANKAKQKSETRERKVLAASSGDGQDETKKSRKRSRGAKQREKKRLRRLEGEEGAEVSATEAAESQERSFKQETIASEETKPQKKDEPKGIKPPKKQNKRQRENMESEKNFTELVNKYKAAFVGVAKDAEAVESELKKKKVLEEKGKRWFE